MLRIAVAATALLGGGCTGANLGDVPYRCLEPDNTCPARYHCASGYCVRDGVSTPVRLSTSVDSREGSFTLHARANDAVLCWSNGLSSREPGLYAAVVSPEGEATGAPRAVYSADSTSVAVNFGLRGTCTVRGESALTSISRAAGQDAYLLRIGRADLRDLGSAMTVFDYPPFAEGDVPHVGGANVGDSTWFVLQQYSQRGFDSRHALFRAVVDANFNATGGQLRLPAFDNAIRVAATELHAGTGGAWLSALLESGRAEFVWLDAAAAAVNWVRPPLTTAVSAFPLTVRGTELAVAYQLDTQGHWQIYWLDTSTTPDLPYASSSARPGPRIDIDPRVRRIAGYADGDRLVLAGATDAEHVRLWSLSWGTNDSPQEIGTVNKLGAVVPQRFALTRVEQRYVVAWTELVPATMSGLTAYTALYTAGVPAPPG